MCAGNRLSFISIRFPRTKTLIPKLVTIGILLLLSGCASKGCIHNCYFTAANLADYILDGGKPQIKTDCVFDEKAPNYCFKKKPNKNPKQVVLNK